QGEPDATHADPDAARHENTGAPRRRGRPEPRAERRGGAGRRGLPESGVERANPRAGGGLPESRAERGTPDTKRPDQSSLDADLRASPMPRTPIRTPHGTKTPEPLVGAADRSRGLSGGVAPAGAAFPSQAWSGQTHAPAAACPSHGPSGARRTRSGPIRARWM